MDKTKRSKKMLLIIIFCLLGPWTVSSGTHRDPDSSILMRRPFPVTEIVEMTCNCNNQIVTEKFNITMQTIFDISDNRTICYLQEHSEICHLLEECEVCTAGIEKCKFSEMFNVDAKWVCQKLTYNLPTSRSDMTREGLSLTDVRFASMRNRRQVSGPCFHPAELGNSVLKTMYHYKYIRIIQKCKYGYTLSDGISRDMRCNYDENKWNPAGFEFEACRPFIHCRVGLKYSGWANCTKGTTTKAPVCHVSCPHYEDKPAAKETSQCHIDGKWIPELPHCAYVIHGEELVPAPNIKLHTLEQEANKVLKKLKGPKKNEEATESPGQRKQLL